MSTGGGMMRCCTVVGGNIISSIAPIPTLSSRQLLLKVASTAVNRADLLQRKGLYPPPPGASSILGLEVCGSVAGIASDCQSRSWIIGEQVMALLTGGGYAEYTTVDERSVIRIPSSASGHPLFDDVTGAAIVETWITAYQLLIYIGKATEGSGETVLIHAGASGVGNAAIQLCRGLGLVPLATTRSSNKIQKILENGAHSVCDMSSNNFKDWIMRETNNRGVDIILDCVGADYLAHNCDAIGKDGRWVLYGLMGGASLPSSTYLLSTLLLKRASISGTTLRSRSEEYKEQLITQFWKHAESRFQNGSYFAVVDSVWGLDEAQACHDYVGRNESSGKVVMRVIPASYRHQ